MQSELGVVVAIELANGLLRVPGRGDFAVRVTGAKQAEQLPPALVVEALVGLGEQPATAIERVGLAAPVAEGLVLHPPPALVELVVGELHHMERIGDLGGTRHHRVEDRPIRAG